MSQRTSTATTWGTMHVIRGERSQTIYSVCKHCGHETYQTVSLDDNPFQVVKPRHVATCRGLQPPPQTVDRPRAPQAVAVVDPPPLQAPGVSRWELAWWVAGALAAGGSLSWWLR